MFPEKNYTLGRGRLFFDKFVVGTKTPTGQRYLGNTTEVNLTSDSESLDHYDSDNGIREKDASVLLQLARSGTFITDHISPANMALFFLGNEEVVTVSAVTAATYNVADVKPGLRYQIGASVSVPAGVRNVSNTVVKVGAIVKVLGTDYSLDAATGGVSIIAGGSIVDGDDLIITYDLAATSHNRVVTAANAQIEGALFYQGNNPRGKNFDYFWPDVNLKPDGDFALKGEEWQQIGFSFEAQKKDDQTEVLYITGRAADGV